MADLVLDRWQRQSAHPIPAEPADPGGLPRVRPRHEHAPQDETTAWRELVIVAAVAMVLGFAQGASVAVGSISPPAREATPVEPGPAVYVPADVHSAAISSRFWRPAGSIATPPTTQLTPRKWTPKKAAGHSTTTHDTDTEAR